MIKNKVDEPELKCPKCGHEIYYCETHNLPVCDNCKKNIILWSFFNDAVSVDFHPLHINDIDEKDKDEIDQEQRSLGSLIDFFDGLRDIINANTKNKVTKQILLLMFTNGISIQKW